MLSIQLTCQSTSHRWLDTDAKCSSASLWVDIQQWRLT